MTAPRDTIRFPVPVVPPAAPWLDGSGSSSWFHTAEWEAVAEWDVPEEWARLGPPARSAATSPYPRRRDLRNALVAYELELAVEEALSPVLEPLPAADPDAGPAEGVVRPAAPPYPRRRDVHRPRPGGSAPTRRSQRRSRRAPTGGGSAGGVAARAGVVVALLAATAAGVSGTLAGEGLRHLTFGEGRDVGPDEARTALALAPVTAGGVVLAGAGAPWDATADVTPLRATRAQILLVRERAAAEAARKAAEAARKAAEAKAAAERAAREEAAERAEAQARRAREEARDRALRSAQRDARGLGRLMAADRGWTGSQWRCLDQLWTRESNWRWNADNPTSSAYGIPQALPGRKMASAGSDWETNPATQIAWGLDYIDDRYGTPCGAWGHSQATGWY